LLRLLVFLVVCGGLGWGGWVLWISRSNAKPAQQAPRPPVPVTIARVIQRTIPVEIRAIGNVEAYSTVNVKSQVEGELMAVHFEEGQDVKKGDLLFTIDPRPFQARLRQSEGNLARDMAQLKNAQADANRYSRLLEQKVVSAEEYEKVRTNADALDAAVSTDQAAVENAKLQLEYCKIISPLDGRTGSLVVHKGNIVKANADTPMVVINEIAHVNVSFAVPEQYLPEIKKHMTQGKLKVAAIIPGDEKRPGQGVITFLDNAVDTTTGTIRLKGTFANDDRRLWPGQFVNVVLTLTSEPNALLVPSQTIQTGQQGQYVFVLNPDDTVEFRPVVSNRTLDGQAIVEKGLKANEKVVTDGQLRLVPGAKVEVKK
jgi:multidrug efflux system membrane fusion protein